MPVSCPNEVTNPDPIDWKGGLVPGRKDPSKPWQGKMVMISSNSSLSFKQGSIPGEQQTLTHFKDRCMQRPSNYLIPKVLLCHLHIRVLAQVQLTMGPQDSWNHLAVISLISECVIKIDIVGSFHNLQIRSLSQSVRVIVVQKISEIEQKYLKTK